MGISGIGPGSLLLILAIVLLIFGTKRLKNLGGDLGGAIKGFKKALSDEKPDETSDEKPHGNSDESAHAAQAKKQKSESGVALANKTQQHKVPEKQK